MTNQLSLVIIRFPYPALNQSQMDEKKDFLLYCLLYFEIYWHKGAFFSHFFFLCVGQFVF